MGGGLFGYGGREMVKKRTFQAFLIRNSSLFGSTVKKKGEVTSGLEKLVSMGQYNNFWCTLILKNVPRRVVENLIGI
jgi:hypothetical protein